MSEAGAVAHGAVVGAGGHGSGAPWPALLMLPGAVAAHICSRRGMRSALQKEGARAGLVTAHFAAALSVCVLALAVLSIDWGRYAQQVGTQVAEAVRDAALPATVALALVAVGLAYAGCVLAGWLGALAYAALSARRSGGNN